MSNTQENWRLFAESMKVRKTTPYAGVRLHLDASWKAFKAVTLVSGGSR